MARSSASGERTALGGYGWQYDQLARITYDALLDDTLVSVRLTDPEAGAVDDLVLVTKEHVEGFQFKSSSPVGAMTFNDLVKKRKTRSGRPADSWLRNLSDGWKSLGEAAGLDAGVSLVTNQWPSSSDRITGVVKSAEGDRNDFATFLAEVLAPLSRHDIRFEEVPRRWSPALELMRHETGFEQEEFERFLRFLRLELSTREALDSPDPVRRRDIERVSGKLIREVAGATAVVVLTRNQLLTLLGWTGRVRLQSTHEFPVNIEAYEPLINAATSLGDLVANVNQGYVALVGPPGSGKSTLLSQSLTASHDRVLRYLAYLPGPGSTRARSEGRAFLHDLVLLFERSLHNRGHLLEDTTEELRQAFNECMEEASVLYADSGRKTVIVVDGLDHVERDYPQTDNLLQELPKPEQVPAGVVFVVGTRTLTPLRPEAREQLESQERVVNLDEHRLSHPAVLAICSRICPDGPGWELVYREVATCAGGHPLSLAYILNKLTDIEDASQAQELLATVPAYEGDVAQQYRAIWDDLEAFPQLQELLAVVTRLRIPFTSGDLQSWFDPPICRAFKSRLSYLFRRLGRSRTVFHDSFRQYVISRSNLTDESPAATASDLFYQRKIADLCQRAERKTVRWEELYHRARIGEDVATMATQKLFREQVAAMRSPARIREDLRTLALLAAEKQNAVELVQAALALSEAESRWDNLEQIDVCAALLDADLPDEAVEYAGLDQRRTVPLAQAYRLAARLGLAGSADGRRVFDSIEPALFDDDDFRSYSGHENDVYVAWSFAAPLFRPLQAVLNVAKTLSSSGNVDDERTDDLRRYHLALSNIVESVVEAGRRSELDLVDQFVEAELGDARGDEASRRSVLVDIRLRVLRHRVEAALEEGSASETVREAIDLGGREGLYLGTLLEWADLGLRTGWSVEARHFLVRAELGNQLSVSDLGYSSDGVIEQRFRYWELCHRAFYMESPAQAGTLLNSKAPDPETPAGNGVTRTASLHSDTEAIDAAMRLDEQVRALASVAASLNLGLQVESEKFNSLSLNVLYSDHEPAGRPRRSNSMFALRRHRNDVLRLLLRVAFAHGRESALALGERIGSQISSGSKSYSLEFRLALGRQFYSNGVVQSWYREALRAGQANLTTGDLDLFGRLELATQLVAHFAGLDEIDMARKLARSLSRSSFGVGYHKDYQFDTWLGLFEDAVADGLQEPARAANDLARLLSAAAPMTEGAIHGAAEKLPAILATRSPGAAVALFEQLVRNGTVSHLSALASLIAELSQRVDERAAPVQALADFLFDIVARSSTLSFPDAAKAVIGACEARMKAPEFSKLLRELRDRVASDVLPTNRDAWLQALGVTGGRAMAVREGPANFSYTLDLRDGSHLDESQAKLRLANADAIVQLLPQVERLSTFRWAKHIDELDCRPNDLQKLREAFRASPQDYRQAEIEVTIGQKYLRLGDKSNALACATEALQSASPTGWGANWGTYRRDAHALAIAADESGKRLHAAWIDLADCLTTGTGRADIFLRDLKAISVVLQTNTQPKQIWPLVREYLNGLADNLALSTEDPLERQPVRWWFPGGSELVSRVSIASSAERALAALIVDHTSHPQWMISEPATTVLAKHRGQNFPELDAVAALLLVPAVPDDIVEAVARGLRASIQKPNPSNVEPVLEHLSERRNLFISALSGVVVQHRPLPAKYRIHIPPGGSKLIGQDAVELDPYEGVLRICANSTGLDEDLVIEHALLATREWQKGAPNDEDAMAALSGAGMNFLLPYRSLVAARAAVGSILGDLVASGALDGMSNGARLALRSFDASLVGSRPAKRPVDVPAVRATGHEVTLERWLAGSDERLSEYMRALGSNGTYVVAARAAATVLNWTNAQEHFTCCTSVGFGTGASAQASPALVENRYWSDLSSSATPRRPTLGDALALENVAMFHQSRTDWISFDPTVAAYLGWRPVVGRPGHWVDQAGETALYPIEWVDGWPGHGERAFDDYEFDGCILVATRSGVDGLRSLGPLTRVSELHRWGRDDSGTKGSQTRTTKQAVERISLT